MVAAVLASWPRFCAAGKSRATSLRTKLRALKQWFRSPPPQRECDLRRGSGTPDGGFTSPGGTLLSGLPPSPPRRGVLHPESDRWRGSSSLALRRRGRASPSSPSSPLHADVDSLRGAECPGSLACGREDRA